MKNILFLSIFICLLSLGSCINQCPGERVPLEQSYAIFFKLFDSDTNQNLLEIASEYNRDSVKVYSGDGRLLFPGPVPGNGSVDLYPYYGTDLVIPLDKDTTEYYYLHLIKQGLDVDTFKIDYRTSIDDCSDKKFTKINLYYNEKLVYSNDSELDSFYVELFKE